MSRINSRFINWGTGTDQVNARAMPANFTPLNYTPIQVASEGADKVSAHFSGIDTFFQQFFLKCATNIEDDWMNGAAAWDNNWVSTVNGAAAAVAATTTGQDSTHLGIVALSTGTSSTGRASISLSNVSTVVPGGGSELTQWIVQMPNVPDGTNTYTVRIGLGDVAAAGDFTNGLYFEINLATSSTNWIIKSASSSTRTTTVTSKAFVNGEWDRLGITLVSGVASYYVNGVMVGTITTNIPNNVAVFPVAKVEKSVGTTSRSLMIDSFRYQNIFATSK